MPATVDHRYAPVGAARDLFECRAPEVLLSGPAGTGKSRACLEKGHLLNLVNPGCKGLIVRKTAVSLAPSTLATFREHIADEAERFGVLKFFGGNAEQPAQYRYSNGSMIGLVGMDNPTKVMSTEWDWAFVDEAIELTVTDWEALSIRLRHGRMTFHQLMGATNPGPDYHWLRKRCASGTTLMLHSRHEDNPRYVRPDGTRTDEGAAYFTRLDGLTGVRRRRLLDGEWAAAEGQIWEGWSEAVHVRRFDVDPGWTRWLAVDFGFTNPLVVQWWAEDGDGRLHLHRELYVTQTLVEDAAKQVAELEAADVEAGLEPVRHAVCDHDAEDRRTFTRHSGISTKAADKRVTRGLQAVAERLVVQPDGRPRVVIHPDALVKADRRLAEQGKPTCTRDEVGGYVWDESTRAKQVAEAPLKENDHGCDAMRYMIMYRDARTTPRVRVVSG